MVTVNGIRRRRRQIAASVPRMMGRWLVLRKILKAGMISKGSA